MQRSALDFPGNRAGSLGQIGNRAGRGPGQAETLSHGGKAQLQPKAGGFVWISSQTTQQTPGLAGHLIIAHL
jgi:hypothetical protein